MKTYAVVFIRSALVSTHNICFYKKEIRTNLLGTTLNLLLLNTTCPVLANSVDPDQLASWSALFVIKYVNFYQKLGSSNLIG